MLRRCVQGLVSLKGRVWEGFRRSRGEMQSAMPSAQHRVHKPKNGLKETSTF